ncbi:MAG: ATP-binding cassette domain-containing protein [Pseudomonadota bacterium]
MIEFRNVSKSFWTGETRKVILDQANFRVDLGKSVGILAPNGTGKTTIINMMAGLEKPDEGKIIRTSKISFPLGVVSGVNMVQSGQENARYIARLYGLDPDYVEAFCRYLIDIGEYFEMPIATYSQGMRSRFTFALMLSLDFDIYLIDEGMPSTMDAEFNRKAGDLLHQRLSRATVVIVSHKAKILESFCTSAAVLRDGRLHMFDTLEEAKEMYKYDMESSLDAKPKKRAGAVYGR